LGALQLAGVGTEGLDVEPLDDEISRDSVTKLFFFHLKNRRVGWGIAIDDISKDSVTRIHFSFVKRRVVL
jgi:hypothetical protein